MYWENPEHSYNVRRDIFIAENGEQCPICEYFSVLVVVDFEAMVISDNSVRLSWESPNITDYTVYGYAVFYNPVEDKTEESGSVNIIGNVVSITVEHFINNSDIQYQLAVLAKVDGVVFMGERSTKTLFLGTANQTVNISVYDQVNVTVTTSVGEVVSAGDQAVTTSVGTSVGDHVVTTSVGDQVSIGIRAVTISVSDLVGLGSQVSVGNQDVTISVGDQEVTISVGNQTISRTGNQAVNISVSASNQTVNASGVGQYLPVSFLVGGGVSLMVVVSITVILVFYLRG